MRGPKCCAYGILWRHRRQKMGYSAEVRLDETYYYPPKRSREADRANLHIHLNKHQPRLVTGVLEQAHHLSLQGSEATGFL
jgi:hypothetical protein